MLAALCVPFSFDDLIKLPPYVNGSWVAKQFLVPYQPSRFAFTPPPD